MSRSAIVHMKNIYKTVLTLLYQVLQDPISFVDKLQRGVDVGLKLPGPQKLAPLPAIDWEKYTSNVDFAAFGTHRQSARLKRQGNEATEGVLKKRF